MSLEYAFVIVLDHASRTSDQSRQSHANNEGLGMRAARIRASKPPPTDAQTEAKNDIYAEKE